MYEKYIIFTIKNDIYGINIKNVIEVERTKEFNINRIPNSPDNIVGLINLRGQIIPIIDLRIEFKLESLKSFIESNLIIVNADKKVVGLLVDKIKKAKTFEENKITDSTEEIQKNNKYITSIINNNEDVLFIIDVDKIVKRNIYQ